MKLSRHEILLSLLSVAFLITITLFSFSGTEGTVANSPTGNAKPYLIDINTASADELTMLDGIGPKLADRIVDYRNKNGKFSSLYELSEVPGIGASVIATIEDYATA